MSNETVFSTMGASNHTSSERQSEDFYASDNRAAIHIFDKMPELMNCENIVEPCAGDGTMADVIQNITNKNVDKYDLISRREDIFEADYFNLDIKNKYDLIITNPPYMKDSKDKLGLTSMIVKMLEDVKPDGYVCLLLKTLHLESKNRYEQIYKTMPPYKIYVYAPRISCYKNNDTTMPQGAISYAWYIWHKEKDGTYKVDEPRLNWIDKL